MPWITIDRDELADIEQRWIAMYTELGDAISLLVAEKPTACYQVLSSLTALADETRAMTAEMLATGDVQ